MGCTTSIFLSRHEIFYRRIRDCWYRSIRLAIYSRIKGLITERKYIPRDIPPAGLDQKIGLILREIDMELRLSRRDIPVGIIFQFDNQLGDSKVYRDYVLNMVRQELFLNGYRTDWCEDDESNWILVYFEPVDMRLYRYVTSGLAA